MLNFPDPNGEIFFAEFFSNRCLKMAKWSLVPHFILDHFEPVFVEIAHLILSKLQIQFGVSFREIVRFGTCILRNSAGIFELLQEVLALPRLLVNGVDELVDPEHPCGLPVGVLEADERPLVVLLIVGQQIQFALLDVVSRPPRIHR